MRITGGKARGIRLQSPAKGQTRPATDYLREAVFASLGALVEGTRVLDCFAGTGAYALEAMSRGAHSATLVEQSAAAVRCMRQNVAAVAKSAGFDAALLDIRQADAIQAVRRLAESKSGEYSLIFVDPPYGVWEGDCAALLAALAMLTEACPAQDARLVLEAPGQWSPPQLTGLSLLRCLKKGSHQPAALIYGKVLEG